MMNAKCFVLLLAQSKPVTLMASGTKNIPLFLSDEELARCSCDTTTVAAKADACMPMKKLEYVDDFGVMMSFFSGIESLPVTQRRRSLR
ncbi:hypothetical protein PIB30_049365 [Stylosanthes scabra]|uniref:Uncharacterized protein n=1 Tax=Stylosanthes scabra TaxID=79078 RepID=A0ABU6THP9_9FABA|nr:hypothetical protein [Stylosanthes scabra]